MIRERMKRAMVLGLAAGVVSLGAGNGQLAMATPTTITDEYFGADPTHNYGHVDSIGGSDFNLTQMVVDHVGGLMKVDIYAEKYFAKTLPFENTLLGDLFISTNGLNTSYPGGKTAEDTYLTGEQWEWVAALSSHGEGNETAGTIGLYIVDKNKIKTSNLNGLPEGGWIYRKFQEWAYNTDGSTPATLGTWTRNDTMLSLSFVMPDAWQGATELGLHWGMSCGNDVIEGEVPVPAPEPATMLLLGTGLLGLAGVTRRRRK